MRRTKGFTLVELLVVIAIIALLMGILMPALARVRAIAFRMTCGTNLSGIGKAMLIYANDYQEEFPIAGWTNSTFTYGLMGNAWMGTTRDAAFGTPPGQATITACFYFLVKFADVTVKSFVCKSDTGVTDLDLKTAVGNSTLPDGFELIDAWDFGPWTASPETPPAIDSGNADWSCSYAYHYPFTATYALTTSSDPGMAVAADPNPWFKHASTNAKSDTFPGRAWEEGPYGSKGPFYRDEGTEHVKFGNAFCHQEEGQNVLYLDGHVTFEKKSFCGIEEDNIYTAYNGDLNWKGDLLNQNNERAPGKRKDAFLIGNRASLTSPN